MENVTVETSWEYVNTSESDNASLFDMCSWGEANQSSNRKKIR